MVELRFCLELLFMLFFGVGLLGAKKRIRFVEVEILFCEKSHEPLRLQEQMNRASRGMRAAIRTDA